MSKLKELIEKLCPDGVEWKTLGNVCEIETGSLNANQAVENGKYVFFTCGKEDKKIDAFRWDTEALLINGNGYLGQVKHFTGKFNAYQRTYVLLSFSQEINVRFLFFVLQNGFPAWAVQHQKQASVPYITIKTVEDYEIPLPPLEVQKEIARILDTFTELETELELRLKQYNYYRDKLLTFGDDVERKNIYEVCEIRNGYTPSKARSEYWENGTIPWFVMEDIRKNGRVLSDSIQHITQEAVKGSGLFKANSIILATSATIGEHALITVDHLSNQRFMNLRIKDSYSNLLDIKYLFYYMFVIDEWCKNNTNVSGFASVDMTKFKDIEIPLPPLAEQKRIADILDRFSELTGSLTSGLPAEIEARRKQYEYYREKLLTFQRKCS